MNAISTFTFHQNHNVRVQLINNEPWFCLSDVCGILSIQNQRDLLAKQLDKKGVEKIYTPTKGGNQQLSYVNEPNLYRVIFRSNKPEAKQFQDWVFNEVLPTIRKTGIYEIQQLKQQKNYITNKDMDNIQRLVWHCSDHLDHKETFSRAVWHSLRIKTGVKSPEKFSIEDLPTLSEEFERIIAIIQPYLNARREAEKLLLSKLIRGHGDYEKTMKEALYLMRNSVEEKTQIARNRICGLFKYDQKAMIERKGI